MKWEDILKIDINMGDARRLGRDYSIEDMYEAKLTTEEEYDEMTDAERRNYHGRVANYLRYSERSRGVNISMLEDKLRFHNIMQSRLQQGSTKPTFARFFEDFESTKTPEQRRARRKLVSNEPEPIRTKIPILDYFMMYRNRGLGLPTVEDIAREEGKELTEGELEEYNNLLERYSE